jgi:hypothetical protein
MVLYRKLEAAQRKLVIALIWLRPSGKLTESLEARASAKRQWACAIGARDITRTCCERLLKHGFLAEVVEVLVHSKPARTT